MKILRFLLVFILLSTMSSCALIFNGSKQQINISSLTEDSKIFVDGQYAGENSVISNVTRKDGHTVMIKKEGYKTENILLRSDVQAGWIVFDALFNWFAFLTDAPTGAWKSFDNNNIAVELIPLKQ
ncbi:hypothetical protein K4L44_12735 [Halosquirtibacter laminarini]|uniref:Uncharacterized protein n=1 Tax=Halosquirtibacter laminarini TaxID=3374600 RepID=A0AC61NJB0_9BACT|nr:hypothetical protein K4L44_12735 [Prolixibacteraceae bacterium]